MSDHKKGLDSGAESGKDYSIPDHSLGRHCDSGRGKRVRPHVDSEFNGLRGVEADGGLASFHVGTRISGLLGEALGLVTDDRSFFARETFARVCASMKLGMAMAARIAIIATTMSNSIRVNPFRIGDASILSCRWGGIAAIRRLTRSFYYIRRIQRSIHCTEKHLFAKNQSAQGISGVACRWPPEWR